MLRHERQTVRMELAAALHHSWGGGLGTHEGLRAQKTASAGPAEYFELSSDDGRPAGEERPAALLEPRPQGKMERHTGVGYELVHRLEVPVPQMGEQMPDVLQFFASFLPGVAEQVIEVPKIFLDTTPQHLGDVLRQPQMVEQLVDVPTVVSYSSLQQHTAEQIVDIPVPGGAGGGGRGHQGFAGQSSTASSSHVRAADGAGEGVFRTFPRMKKSAKRSPHSGSELGADFTSTLSAHQMPPEQLVDVPEPEVPQWVLDEEAVNLRRVQDTLLRVRWEAEEAARLALLEEQRVHEAQEEVVVEVSRFLPHFRPRRVCRYVLAGSICPRGWDCTFAHHESELHPDSW